MDNVLEVAWDRNTISDNGISGFTLGHGRYYPENWLGYVADWKEDTNFSGITDLKIRLDRIKKRENKMELKVKLLQGDSLPPFRASEYAAGIDFIAYETVHFHASDHCKKIVETGCAVEIPERYVGLLAIRSSLAASGFSLCNGVGIIDSDYRGEIKALICYNGCDESLTILRGDRFIQMIIVPVNMVNISIVQKLSETGRGEGGFGSTGK